MDPTPPSTTDHPWTKSTKSKAEAAVLDDCNAINKASDGEDNSSPKGTALTLQRDDLSRAYFDFCGLASSPLFHHSYYGKGSKPMEELAEVQLLRKISIIQ